jgi:multisubunit Na+/H+ antiporter MnhG subunit
MTMIPVGFAIFLWGLSDKSTSNKIFGAIFIVLAIILWAISLARAEVERKQEKEDRDKKHKELIDAINNVNKKPS